MRKIARNLRRRLRDPFRDLPVDRDRRTAIMALPPAERRYAIFFTPRSGSSRLTALASGTATLGQPGEVFNPALLPGIARALSAGSMAEYVALLCRKRNAQGTFGCQITHDQLTASFDGPRAFLDLVAPTHVAWLVREDIVAQAVSLSRKLQTRLAHSVGASPARQTEAEARFAYDARQIARALSHIARQERLTERLLRRHRLRPLRLSYERTIAAGPEATLAALARHLGLPPPSCAASAGHEKLAGTKALDFAARFRAEHPRLVARIGHAREGTIAALAPIQEPPCSSPR